MAPHSSTLAWKIPWTEEPDRLQSMGSLRVGHDQATSLFTFMHWGRKWQPTPVFLPGESQERGSLVGCRLWGRTEPDTTEATQQQQQQSKDMGRIKRKLTVMGMQQMSLQQQKAFTAPGLKKQGADSLKKPEKACSKRTGWISRQNNSVIAKPDPNGGRVSRE